DYYCAVWDESLSHVSF
nr:immunoglobulin light chain junction region [Macaca mulatta]